MNKKVIAIISILALIIVAFVLISSSIKLNPPIFIKGAVVTEKGTVIKNVTDGIDFAKPTFLRVRKEEGILSGSEIKVIYYTAEYKAENSCGDPGRREFKIKPGESIEVHGVAIADDTISICPSADYYIKILGAADSPQPQGAKISTEQECKSFLGQWRGDTCVLPASDVGKQCSNYSECQAACIAELTPEEKRLLTDEYGKHTFEKSGHCSEFVFGCYARVNNGKVDEILCAD